MKKEILIGTKIFGGIFILMAVCLINMPIGYLMAYLPGSKHSAADIIYNGYVKRIQQIEDLKKEQNTILFQLGNEAVFNKKFNELKQEAAVFKEKYIVQREVPLHTKIFVSMGFSTCLLYLIVGLGLLLHFLWARRLALWSILFSFLFYLAFLFDLFSVTDLSLMVNYKYSALDALLIPSHQKLVDSYYGSQFTSFDVFESIFLNPAYWLTYLPLFIYTVILFFYFTRPKVKEQFK